MDDSKKRWSVTFTKHIKQKTKVYKDGFLDLHISTNKVKLLDECEKLLECRILKNDEVVSSGETLTFNAYFVDVGDPQGDCKHIPDLSYQGRYKRKPVPGSLSPSHKMIREFKKRELQKYGTPRSSPEETKPRITEWQVLYTTQLTQKAKKYHDGFLQLATSGSLGRQIMLFDETRKLLDSRFLRRDEIIRSGESTAFDGHLVEIGECEEKDGPPMGLNVQGNNGNVAGKSEVMHGHQSCTKTDKYDGKEFKKIEVPGCGAAQGSLDTTNSNITEWQVMYTTQVTQKAKKYHDGFLRLAVTGSLQRQVMLYDDGRKLLNCRFLKQDEKIISGKSIPFGAHLVDIGEPQESHQVQMGLNVQENIGNVVRRTGIKLGKRNCLKADDSVVKGKPQNAACSWENADSSFSISSVQDVKVGKSVSTSKPLRNAVQIMSILQKPKAPGSVDVGCTGNSLSGQLSSTKMLEVSDTVVAVMGDGQLPGADPGSYNYIDTVRSNEETDIATSTGSGSQISRGTEIENFDQSHLDVKGCGKGNDETSGLGIMGAGTSNGPGHGERNNSQEPKSESKMDEFPSFNLGF